MENKKFEVIIIGGSYAGLSAAMALGRSLRKVLIIDSGSACNRQTPHSHNFITQDGVPPAKISEKAKNQVLQYKSVAFINDLAIKAEKTENGFTVDTQSGEKLVTNKIIFATGIKDLVPPVPGFKECWGISLIHCPYCHGFEFRTKKTGILANGERAFHLASLVSNLTNDLIILTTGKADFKPEQFAKLEAHRIPIIETEIAALEHQEGQVKNIVFTNGDREIFDALYAGFPFKQHSDIPLFLGCELTEQGYIRVNEFQQTTIDGVYACGDNTSRMRSVAAAVASGNLAGAMTNAALTKELF
tara:strand:- start:1541 stop:2446 length:906 start_codon:yes stop_codon:yes gene_type:complete